VDAATYVTRESPWGSRYARPVRAVLLLAGLLGTQACYDDPYGAMIEASGDVAFDHVEVFFGHEVGVRTPLTPSRMARGAVPLGERQLLLERMKADDDALMKTPSPRETHWNYLVPYNDTNKDLGRYALIVVSQGTTPVGAAELFDFVVPSDVLNRYFVPIVPLANEDFERWGGENECVRWTRPREATDGRNAPDTIAVIDQRLNTDCDAFVANDCDDMRHCDPSSSNIETSGCYAPDACYIATAAGCASGSCVNHSGDLPDVMPPCDETTTCMDARLCDACNQTQDPAEIAECIANTPAGSGTHPDLDVPLMGDSDNRTLCTKPTYDFLMTLPTGMPCLDPRIESVAQWYRAGVTTGPIFDLQIVQSADNICKIKITEPFPNAPWIGTPHVVASVRNSSGGSYQRVRFTFGLYDNGIQCTQSNSAIYTDPILGCD